MKLTFDGSEKQMVRIFYFRVSDEGGKIAADLGRYTDTILVKHNCACTVKLPRKLAVAVHSEDVEKSLLMGLHGCLVGICPKICYLQGGNGARKA